jgi:hypothetical protein
MALMIPHIPIDREARASSHLWNERGRRPGKSSSKDIGSRSWPPTSSRSSVITAKAANGYHFKTGHGTSVRDRFLYSFGVTKATIVFDFRLECKSTWAEDSATLGSDASADSGAKTEAGCREMPRFVFELRDWQKAINPIKECPPSLLLVFLVAR